MRMVPVTVTLLAGLAFLGLASAAHGGREPLFPRLRGEDFPRDANEVRFAWQEAAPGSLVGHAFHTRPNEMVFASLVTAAATVDRDTGLTTLKVVRLDDDCLAFADEVDARPEEACLAVTATEVARDVLRVSLTARVFDYRVHFYLVQSRQDAAEWNLVSSGRRGEPQVLSLRTSEADGAVVADWLLSYRGERSEVSLPLHVTLPAGAVRDAGLSTVHAALASAPELFYDMADFMVWEVMREEQLIDTAPLPPGAEEDPGDCDVLTMCPAEYQSCTPTTGGWLACGGFDGGWGGGGIACPIGGCGRTKGSHPDWLPGSSVTSPAAVEPLFSGLTAIPGGYELQYSITSVLASDDTYAKLHNAPIMGYASHVVSVSLKHAETLEDMDCGEIRYVREDGSVGIDVGSSKKYKGSDGLSLCDLPRPGLYKLRYGLDPHHQWDEGNKEGNNQGLMRGSYRVPE